MEDEYVPPSHYKKFRVVYSLEAVVWAENEEEAPEHVPFPEKGGVEWVDTVSVEQLDE